MLLGTSTYSHCCTFCSMTSQVPEHTNKHTGAAQFNIDGRGALHLSGAHLECDFNINDIFPLPMTGQQICFLSLKIL